MNLSDRVLAVANRGLKHSLKYKAAKFYNNLPEEIRFDLGDSVR